MIDSFLNDSCDIKRFTLYRDTIKSVLKTLMIHSSDKNHKCYFKYYFGVLSFIYHIYSIIITPSMSFNTVNYIITKHKLILEESKHLANDSNDEEFSLRSLVAKSYYSLLFIIACLNCGIICEKQFVYIFEDLSNTISNEWALIKKAEREKNHSFTLIETIYQTEILHALYSGKWEFIPDLLIAFRMKMEEYISDNI